MDEQALEKNTRIFVGGLGEHVSEDDLLKLFSSLGKAENLEIIRTKGRSIAYVDFSPSSSKSLPKLFSTYNGCVWKGGKLRLDKAKEHYLIRLKREWEEDARLASEKTRAEEGGDVIEEPTKVAIVEKGKPRKKISDAEKAQIRLFFPKLKKVKSLPFSGTGKHKYSFQRIEVPSMPIHFCDCEEHSVSVPSHTGIVDHILNVDSHNGGMTKEEFNMMNSVLNKLFEAHNIPKIAPDPVADGDQLVESTDGPLPSSDHSENDDEDDDLIINIGSNRQNKLSVPGWAELESVVPNQDMRDQMWTSHDEKTPSTLHSQPKKVASSSPNKKKELISGKESDENYSASSIPKERKNLQSNLPKLDALLETTGSELGEQQLRGRSWSQKSSWKKLVGDGASSVFSVSDVLVDNASVKKKQKKSRNPEPATTCDKQTQNLRPIEQLPAKAFRGKNLEEFEEAQLDKSNEVQKSVSDVREQQKSVSIPSFVGRDEEPVHSEDVQEQTSKSNELETCEKSQAVKPNETNNSRGASWYQKSSWTQLVGGTNNSTFSISDIVPSGTFVNQVAPKSNNISQNSGVVEHCAVSNHGISVAPVDSTQPRDNVEGSTNAPKTSVTGVFHAEQNVLKSVVHQTTSENNTGNMRSTNEVSAPSTVKKEQKAPQKSIADILASETCTFMCSAASMKEWANAKAAVSGSRKRKTVEKETH